jgi:UDP:flavonoid glycosyltransferase YjiC (YdhE family)
LKRVIAALGKMEVRALVNVGDYIGEYSPVPENVHIATWFPQPSVIPKVDMVIHHGGNNSFTECLYFGKPAIIMPYVWDGHDNATRIEETGHGFKLDRYNWTEEELAGKIRATLKDKKMKARLKKTSVHMRARKGTAKAAKIIDGLMRKREKAA